MSRTAQGGHEPSHEALFCDPSWPRSSIRSKPNTIRSTVFRHQRSGERAGHPVVVLLA